MPTGPKGEKRPADAIARAVKVMRIATGEEQDYGDAPQKNQSPLNSAARAARSAPRACRLSGRRIN